MAPKVNDNKIKPNLDLVKEIDSFASDLMDDSGDANLTEKQDTLTAVTKWVGVRHKLIDVESLDGTGLTAYRDALKPARALGEERTFADTATAVLSKSRGRPPNRPAAEVNHIGSDIDSLAASLPASDAGSVRRDSKGPSGEVDSFTERLRSIRAGISGDDESE
jgi:hypothetical protein